MKLDTSIIVLCVSVFILNAMTAQAFVALTRYKSKPLIRWLLLIPPIGLLAAIYVLLKDIPKGIKSYFNKKDF